MTPTRSRGLARPGAPGAAPRIRRCPAYGSIWPRAALRIVVLPAPFGPITTQCSPRRTCQSTSAIELAHGARPARPSRRRSDAGERDRRPAPELVTRAGPPPPPRAGRRRRGPAACRRRPRGRYFMPQSGATIDVLGAARTAARGGCARRPSPASRRSCRTGRCTPSMICLAGELARAPSSRASTARSRSRPACSGSRRAPAGTNSRSAARG